MSELSVKDDVRKRVEGRLKELEPMVREYDELRRIVDALDQAAAPASPRGSGRAAPRRALSRSGAGRAGHSARGDEAQAQITAQPGITVSELAQRMGIGTTYLYRLLPRLEREGKLRKEGRGYHPA